MPEKTREAFASLVFLTKGKAVLHAQSGAGAMFLPNSYKKWIVFRNRIAFL